MGQTASAGASNLCCRPSVSGDSSPIAAMRIEGEPLPTLLSTPTAGAQKDNKATALQTSGIEGRSQDNAEDEVVEELSEQSGEVGPNRASSKTPWAQGQQVDVTVTESQMEDGPNRESGPGPVQGTLSKKDTTAASGEEAQANAEEGGAATATEVVATNSDAQPVARPKRTREERKELRRQQRANAKERLRPFLTKNGFAGPNTPRRRLFRTQFPIHAAVSQNNAEVVKLLIIAGVDITKTDSAGRTAQELARREHSRHNSHAQVLALLTEAQRRRAARMARRNQAAEGVAATGSGQQQHQTSTESGSVGNMVTSSTVTTEGHQATAL